MSEQAILPAPWSERVWRLRLGIAPRDALGRPGPIGGLGLHSESVPKPWLVPPGPPEVLDPGIGLPGIPQSPSGRFAVKYERDHVDAPGAPKPLVVRIVDRHRAYVARRFSIPVPKLETVQDADAAHAADPASPLTPRAFRPVLFPGSAYGTAAGATVVRGRVVWESNDRPAAWARVAARTADEIEIRDDNGDVIATLQPLLGRAHGDEKGEFVLVVGPVPSGLGLGIEMKLRTLDLSVRVQVRPEPPVTDPVESPTGSRDDPLWHLPVEDVASLSPTDPVATGDTVPAGYTAGVTKNVTCRLGTATRPAVTFVVPGP